MKHFLLTYLFFWCFIAVGQDSNLQLMAKVKDENVHIKIIPANAYTWLEGLKNGYVLYRKDLSVSDEYIKITDDVIKPMNQTNWLENGSEASYNFHKNAKHKIDSILQSRTSLLSSIDNTYKADENYKIYALLTLTDNEIGGLNGTQFIDETAEIGHLYEYKVLIKDSSIESIPLFFNTNQILSVQELQTESLEKKVKISWYHNTNSPIIAYELFKSSDRVHYESVQKGLKFPKVVEYKDSLYSQSISEEFIIDSIGSNYIPQYYKLKALDVWGDLIESSQIVMGMGKDKTPPKVESFKLTPDTSNHTIVIEWEPPSDNDVNSYFITVADALNGRDSLMVGDLPNHHFKYVIQDPIDLKNYHIKIGAIDTSGNVGLSNSKLVFIPDHTAPEKVKNILFNVDSSGMVRLSWDNSFDHNMKGYWVHRAYSKNGLYYRITDTVITENHFYDDNSLALLNNVRYYYIEAIDKSFNISEQSEIVEVHLPDTIPPSTTYIDTAYIEDSALKIKFTPSVSEDVEAYLVYRWVDEDWLAVGETTDNAIRMLDHSKLEKHERFSLKVRDRSGNVSDFGATYNWKQKGTIDFTLTAQQVENQFKLEWSPIANQYKIYKFTGGTYKLQDIQLESTWEDSKIETATSYYVKAYDNEGRLIAISNTISK